MKRIESYNSSYPLAYYEIGKVYSFYGQTTATGTPASEEQVRKYAPILDDLIYSMENRKESAIKPVKGGSSSSLSPIGMNRFYAVVTNKVRSGKDAHIVVMLCNKSNGETAYYTKQYAVNYGCSTDGKELMPASAHLSIDSRNSGKAVGRVGGVTLAEKEQKVGGITRANGKNTTTSSIGGITKANKSGSSAVKSSNIGGKVGGITRVHQPEAQSASSSGKVGGITRVRQPENQTAGTSGKVGGITRVKK